MQNLYDVSVIIPTYNRADLVQDAVESVLNQAGATVQVIVVDDGSTDHTREALSRWGDRITTLFQPNQGQAVARNRGLELARGEFVAFLDSDDIWLPGKLAAELPFLRKDPSLEALISDAEFYSENKLETPSRFAESAWNPVPDRPVPFDFDCQAWAWGSLVATCCMLVKRSSLTKMGSPVFAEHMAFFEDWDFELRMYHHCKTLIHPQICARIRRFPDETRSKRPFPGAPLSYEQQVYRVSLMRNVMERFLSLPGLPPVALELARMRLDEFLQHERGLLAS
ncbi:MAG: glycosyltransferase [Bacteroidia bacterium]|nr:glycosyltransferase [Bacteroidia bacterium]